MGIQYSYVLRKVDEFYSSALSTDDLNYVYSLYAVGSLFSIAVFFRFTRSLGSSRQSFPPSTNSKGGFPEYTFSTSALVVSGQATIVEYDSSAGAPAGKPPVACPTILQELSPVSAYQCDSTNLANSDGSQPTPFSGSLKSPVELDPPVDNEYQMDAAQLLQSTSLASPHNIGGGVLRSLSRAPPSHEEPTHHARPEGLLSSSSQTLDDIRYKTSSTPTRSDKPHSQSSSPSIVTDTLSRTTSIPPNILPLPTDEVSTIKPTLRLPEEEETVSPPGAHIYIRRVVRNTAFFQFADKVEGAVEAPFELSNHPDLVAGDLFYHRSGMKCQLWIWEKEAAQSLRWRAIGWGYERKADRKVLILSEKKALPSWVQKSHFLKHTQNHPELQAMVMMPGQ